MEDDAIGQVSVRFKGENGDELGAIVFLVRIQCLSPSFTEDGIEIVGSIEKSLDKIDFEKTLCLVYQPQAVFRVQPVTRCSSSMPGHGEPVISAQFSPDGR
ncbi:hypothetical protein COOONC_22661 [Cooperia oncophora]